MPQKGPMHHQRKTKRTWPGEWKGDSEEVLLLRVRRETPNELLGAQGRTHISEKINNKKKKKGEEKERSSVRIFWRGLGRGKSENNPFLTRTKTEKRGGAGGSG